MTIWATDSPCTRRVRPRPRPRLVWLPRQWPGNLVTLRWTIPPGGPVPTDFVLEGGVHPGGSAGQYPDRQLRQLLFTVHGAERVILRAHARPERCVPERRVERDSHPRQRARGAVGPGQSTGARERPDPYALPRDEHLYRWLNDYRLRSTRFFVSRTPAPWALTETFSFAGVPPGTYAFSVRAQNAAGSSDVKHS